VRVDKPMKALQKVAFKSAKPTTDTSPALQCWEERAKKIFQSVKRTAELSKYFSRPLRGLIRWMRSNPSTEVLGYWQSSRFAGLYSDFLCKAAHECSPRALAAVLSGR
jgi:hypothetical protein